MTLDPIFSKSIERVTHYLNDQWAVFKKDYQRPLNVLLLPHFADPRSFHLSLLNSTLYLKQMFDQQLTRLYAPGISARFQLPKV